jgi:cytochrome P450
VLVYQHFQARPVKHVPGPFSFPFIGNVPHLMNRPWSRVLQYSKVHGGIFKVFVWGSPFLFVSDPDAIKRIFVTNHKNYAKDPWSYKLFGRILGKGLVTSEGPLWKAERALLSPAFHTNALGRLIPCFSQAGERFVKSLASVKAGQPVEICAAYRYVVSACLVVPPPGPVTLTFLQPIDA